MKGTKRVTEEGHSPVIGKPSCDAYGLLSIACEHNAQSTGPFSNLPFDLEF